MRSLVVSCNISVDGFMSRPDGELDFLIRDEAEEDALAARFESEIDTIVVGRVTFEEMAAAWTKESGRMARWLTNARKVVLTTDSHLNVDAWENSKVASGDAIERVRELKNGDGKGLVAFGGVRTLQTLVAASLVDEFWLKIHPVMIGGGKIFTAELGLTKNLKVKEVQSYPSGLIETNYMA